MKVAVLDDYQSVAQDLAAWSQLPDGTEVSFFQDHLADEASLVSRLKEFQVVNAHPSLARFFPSYPSFACW